MFVHYLRRARTERDELGRLSSVQEVRRLGVRITGDATAAAFPLGGIGTGNVSLGARGELRDWEICNGAGRGTTLPFTFFALRVAGHGRDPVTKVLESRLRPPYERPYGYWPGEVAGLPRFRESSLRGEYPFAWIDLLDDSVPVSTTLEAFTPLVPLDAAESGLPAAVLRYRLRNVTDATVEVTVVGSLFNPVGMDGGGADGFPRVTGDPRNEFRDDGVLRGLFMCSSLPDDHLKSGTVTMVTAADDVTVKPDWPAWGWEGGIADFWSDLAADGRLESRAEADFGWIEETWLDPRAKRELLTAVGKLHVGSLGVVEAIPPGVERVVEFLITWHFPNRPRAWAGGRILEPTNAHQVVRNFYATRFGDAWQVARHLHDNLPDLERHTRSFHDALYGSTLPSALVDAVASNVATLRSTTCFRLADGTFAGWEGSGPREGSCEGSCTHVWNYAQTVAFLFPELERSMRRAEFCLETDADGRMNFRGNRIFGGKPWGFAPAADGQLGTIVRLYRDWRFSGDDAFLDEVWPSAAAALEYALTRWDTDGDDVLDGTQHNTYDVDFHGPTPHANALLFAALIAAAKMAEHRGETGRADRYRAAAARGAATMDRLLWNGEFYVQRLDNVDARRHQVGTGCLADQLFGQLLAHLCGLGYLLPVDHVKKAVAAIYRHNFRPALGDHVNTARVHALGDEGGVVVCSWPLGGRPRRPLPYADEVWTGIEYQLAAQLIYEGFVEEGLTVVRAVRRRHDGYRRSPWNEAEAGYHYVRSMASWALLLAYSGCRYDAVARTIGFGPVRTNTPFRCFFSTATAWGVFSYDHHSTEIAPRYGSLSLEGVWLRPPVPSADPAVVRLRVNGDPRPARVEHRAGELQLRFAPLTLAAGDILGVDYAPGH
jgi:uncharacterized protein (DUF608 family)